MNRRGFLAGMLALGVAPAIVKASSLMQVKSLSSLPWWQELVDAAVKEKIDQINNALIDNARLSTGMVDPRGIFGRSEFPKILWPGVQEFWGKHYDNIPVILGDFYEPPKLP